MATSRQPSRRSTRTSSSTRIRSTPRQGVYRGRDAFRGYFERFREEWDDYRVNAEEVRDSGDKVLVFTRQSARGKASGVQIDLRIAHLWTIRDGKAVRMQAYFDREEALKALEE